MFIVFIHCHLICATLLNCRNHPVCSSGTDESHLRLTTGGVPTIAPLGIEVVSALLIFHPCPRHMIQKAAAAIRYSQ